MLTVISDFPRPLRQRIRIEGQSIDIPQIGSLDQVFLQIWSAIYSLSGRGSGGAVLSGPLNVGQNRLFGVVNQEAPADDEALAYETAQALYAPSVMAIELSLLGSNPLNVQGLHGLLADPQMAGIPVVAALPDPNFAHTDEIVIFSNILYRFDTTTEPGHWVAVTTSGVLGFGLFANRPAQPQPAGVEYLATDRGWLYYSTGAVWNYEYGAMFGTRATRVGLGMAAGDAGALFYETDTGWLYRYSGTAWAYRWGVDTGTNAVRLALGIGAADEGAWFYATDTQQGWQVASGAWTMRAPYPTSVNTTPVTVNANSVADQNLMSWSIAAGYLNVVGKTVRGFAAGVYTTQALEVPTLTFRLKLGGVTLASWVSSAAIASATSVPWNLDFEASVNASGGTGNLETHGTLQIDLGATGTVTLMAFADDQNAPSAAIDLAAAQSLQLTVAFSTQPAGAPFNSATERQLSAGIMG